MLRIKKRQEEKKRQEAEAAAAAAAAPSESKSDASAAESKQTVSILGVSGKRSKTNRGGARKMTPGEMVLQKGA